MTTKTLDVTLQFQFDRFGKLQETFVSIPPSTVEVQGSWTSPLSQWSLFDSVSVAILTVRPPADITYTLVINNTRTEIVGGYFHCVLGLLAEGTSFLVEASSGGYQHQVRMNFASKLDASAGGHRKPKIAILVPPTTDPPPSTPIGSEIDDLVALLPHLINDLRDRVTLGGVSIDTVLRKAEAIVRRFNFPVRPVLDSPSIEPRRPTRE